MVVKRMGNIPSNISFLDNFSQSAVTLFAPIFPTSKGEEKEESSLRESSLSEELRLLIKDCQELSDMHKDTKLVEKEIASRVKLLKDEIRQFIESIVNLPVYLDGELLTYEETTRERVDVTSQEEETKLGNIRLYEEKGKKFYYYTQKTIYQLDVDEEELLDLIHFVNAREAYTKRELLDILKAYQQAQATSYGYRMAYLTSIDEKTTDANTETTVYTGTVFNNTEYSKKNHEFLKKILLKVKADYVSRTHSTYPKEQYIIKRVKGKFLIVHTPTGATDLLTDDESNFVIAISHVRRCYDKNNLLINDKRSDFQIDVLQQVLEEYLQKKKAMVK